jgi:KUP system potassium uptake protein
MVKPLEDILEPGAPEHREARDTRTVLQLALTALGVVFGDIGTSPLYAVKVCFHGPDATTLNATNIYGVLSLIFWSLVIIISIKYLLYVMNADNRGEGGIMALMSLVHPGGRVSSFKSRFLVVIGLFGAALLYGDGTITPAISVLSAVEGLGIATEFFHPYIVPITVVILIMLFIFQRQGTQVVGSVFGPIMVLWFTTLAFLGITGIIRRPEVLAAINPAHAFAFFRANGWEAFILLGLIFLVVTGGEALYADMGHFGRKPIRLAWFSLVFPALLLNYFGQGALLLDNPHAAVNPFYHMAPSWGIYPLVLLSTMATVIASQAVISGAFSLTRQAIQLGYCPLMKIEHTSAEIIGQIYLSAVNWLLMIATIFLVVWFQKSSNLANAYGVAVSTTMVITTLLTGVVAYELWGWPKAAAVAVAVLFLIPDSSFFAANLLKVESGGWYPLLIAAAVYTVMSTWRRGRDLLKDIFIEKLTPLPQILESIRREPPPRVPGTAVFLSSSLKGIPGSLLAQLKHNKVLHERVLLLTIITKNVPRVGGKERLTIEDLDLNFYRVINRQGFLEEFDMSSVVNHLSRMEEGLENLSMEETSFFLGQSNIIPAQGFRMIFWRAKLFSFMERNALSMAQFLNIPAHRVVELGIFVEF